MNEFKKYWLVGKNIHDTFRLGTVIVVTSKKMIFYYIGQPAERHLLTGAIPLLDLRVAFWLLSFLPDSIRPS
jgi:hypothetical protein